MSTALPGSNYGSADWGDFDGDGWPDLIVGGMSDGTGKQPVKMYHNNGGATFTDITSSFFFGSDDPAVVSGTVNWLDLDADARLPLQ